MAEDDTPGAAPEIKKEDHPAARGAEDSRLPIERAAGERAGNRGHEPAERRGGDDAERVEAREPPGREGQVRDPPDREAGADGGLRPGAVARADRGVEPDERDA